MSVRFSAIASASRHVQLRSCIACALLIPMAGPCIAQTSGTPAADPGPNPQNTGGKPAAAQQAVTLGQVYVTANLRREPSREVPMHVDTVSALTLQQLGAKTLSDYASYQPGVFYASAGGSGQGELVMRGVSTGNQTSPTVSVYIDDVPVGGSTVYASAATFLFDTTLMDLDHVEFLYGPQGTLYGAGSMGGLIKYVTNKPDSSGFSGNAGFDLSDTQHADGLNYTEHATVNLPLKKDVAALRVSVFDQHTAGIYRAVGETPAGGDDRDHTRGARVQLEVDPTDKLSFNITAMAQHNAADGLSMADYSLATEQPISGGPYDRRLNHREPFVQDLALYSFRASYDFGWANLDWISSYQDFTNHSVQDYPDGFLSLLNQLGPLFGVDNELSSLYVDSRYDVHKAAQEIRLTSAKGDRFEWLTGLWFDRESSWAQYVLEGAAVPPPGNSRLLQQLTDSTFREYAGYGDVTWHVAPLWDLTVGVRASGNSQQLSNFEDGPVAGSPGGFREHMTSDDITKMLTLSYRPDITHSYYMRASTGYRPGGLQAPVTSTIFGTGTSIADTFASDALTSYELGYKGSHLDGKLSLGIDAYDIEWHNVQIITYTLGNSVVQNAGDARIDGLEVQASYTSGPWQFSGAAAYTDARTLQANLQQGIADGAPLPYSAKGTATIGSRYKFSLADDEAYAGATWRISSKRNAGFDNDTSDPNFNLPGFGLLDLDTGVTLHSGTSIDLYLRNALDRRFPVGVLNDQTISFLASFGGPMLVQMSTPRTLGVSVNVPF